MGIYKWCNAINKWEIYAIHTDSPFLPVWGHPRRYIPPLHATCQNLKSWRCFSPQPGNSSLPSLGGCNFSTPNTASQLRRPSTSLENWFQNHASGDDSYHIVGHGREAGDNDHTYIRKNCRFLWFFTLLQPSASDNSIGRRHPKLGVQRALLLESLQVGVFRGSRGIHLHPNMIASDLKTNSLREIRPSGLVRFARNEKSKSIPSKLFCSKVVPLLRR